MWLFLIRPQLGMLKSSEKELFNRNLSWSKAMWKEDPEVRRRATDMKSLGVHR